jgi:hypothetical protein
MHPGMFVNEDTEPRKHIVLLFHPVVYLQRNDIGIILHFQVRRRGSNVSILCKCVVVERMTCHVP